MAKKATLSTPDRGLEERLADRGVKFEYLENVPIEEFDAEQSSNNQARLGALDEATVVKYQDALEAGDALPALVAYRAGNGKLVIISGLHRLAAYTRLGLPVNVYEVIDASPNTRLELTFTENLKHGLPTSPEERLRQALHLVENGMSATAASKKLLVPLGRLERARSTQESRRRAIAAGLSLQEWEDLAPSTRQRLYGVHTDEGFAELARLTVAAGLSAEEVTDVISAVNTSRSGEQQRALVKDLRAQVYQDRVEKGGTTYEKTRGKKATPRSTLERTITMVRHLPELSAVVEYYPGDRSEIIANIDDAIGKLNALRAGFDGA
jgi:hypothetical protein